MPRPEETHTPLPYWQRAALSVCALAGAVAVAVSRIYLSYHTPKQVLVGCLAGALFAFIWFTFTSYLRSEGWIHWALDTGIARMLRMRDLVIHEDLVDAGWARWEERRRRGAKKNI